MVAGSGFKEQIDTRGVRPTLLDGERNGRIDSRLLVTIPHEHPGEPLGYQLVLPAARAYRAMHAAARSADVIVKPVSPGDTYRTFEQQTTLFESRYVPNGPCEGCRDCVGYERRCKKCNEAGRPVATAACPGTSNHGWGLAVDVGTESDDDSGTDDLDAATLGWLEANAQRFGFAWELESEPWHIHFVEGDVVPGAVLAHEATHGGPPLPRVAANPVRVPPEPEGDDEMPTHRWAPKGFINQFEMPGCLPVTPGDVIHIDGRGGKDEADPFAALPLIVEFHIHRLMAIIHRNGITPALIDDGYFIRDPSIELTADVEAAYRKLGLVE